jgi:hypothetical protein
MSYTPSPCLEHQLTSYSQDGSKFLEAVSAKRGAKGAGVDILSLGREAVVTKQPKGAPIPWSDAMRQEFRDALKKKML